MFRKLISNLPFSPGLLPQVSFYARRISQENVIRRMGLVFAGLTIIMQSLFFLSPPTPSLAGSANDLIYGGLRTSNGQDLSHDQAVKKVIDNVYSNQGNTNGLKALFEHYGVTEAMVKNSKTSYVCSQRVDRTVNGINCNKSEYENIRSIGRQKKSTQDVLIDASGTSKTFYHRPLSIFDKLNPVNTYKVLELVPSELYILYSCGNLAFSELPTPKIENPNKKIINKSAAYSPGDRLTYEISVTNTGNVAANNLELVDQLDENLKAIRANQNGRVSNGRAGSQSVSWNIQSLAPTEVFRTQITVELRNASEPRVCNNASVRFDDGNGGRSKTDTNTVCFNTEEPTPEQPQPVAEPACTSLAASDNNARIFIPATLNFNPIVDSDGVNISSYEYFVNNASQGAQSEDEFSYTFNNIGEYTVAVIVNFDDGTQSDRSDCEFSFQTTEEPNEEVDAAKSGRVVVSHNPVEIDENDPRSASLEGATVKVNELIEYTVSVSNTGNVDVSNYNLPKDDLRDVLEYADVINAEGEVENDYSEPVQLRGGGQLVDGEISWNEVESLRVGETITKTFFVQVKPKIPTTNTPPSDQLSYDCIMSNVYENSIDVEVDCSAEKEVIGAATSLPRTGPGEIAIITGFMVALSAYLYQRNKQLVKELKIVKSEYSGGLS